MFTKSAAFYDAIYSWKDYGKEVELLRASIDQNKQSSGSRLLDVACGTGHHAYFMQETYQVEGLDLDADLLKIGRQRCPTLTFHQADMTDFELGKQFDIVICLFSAIGYAKTVERLNSTMHCIARHLLPGGVALVEPWLFPGQFEAGHVAASYVNLPTLKITRMNTARAEDGISFLDFHYLVGTPKGVEHFTETHELALFSDAQYRAAFEGAGLKTTFDAEGIDGRGLYIGVKA